MDIKTNNHYIPMLYGYELPEDVKATWQEMCSIEDIDGESFVKYKGNYYWTGDIMRASQELQDKGWQGYHAHGYFSGVVFKFDDEMERCCCGTYFS